MLVKIRYRCDQEDYYCTDDITIKVADWDEVLKHVKQIEKSDTVLTIERVLE